MKTHAMIGLGLLTIAIGCGDAQTGLTGSSSLNTRTGQHSGLDDTGFDANGVDNTNGTATVLLVCETRSNRSKVSVNGNNFASGNYSATISSGSQSAQSAPVATVGDEVEFDFDSSRDDIAAGATAISANFISGSVTGLILNDAGDVVATVSANCVSR